MATANESANNAPSGEQQQDGEHNDDVEKDQQGGSEKSAREQQEKRNFYQAELERLRNVAREELKRPVYKEPERKGFTPFVHNQLGSYLDTSGASFLIEQVGVKGLPDTPSRYTATKLHDPWFDHRMESPRAVASGSSDGAAGGSATARKTPRQPPKQQQQQQQGEKGGKKKEDPHAGERKQGSTHLPPFPRVNIDYSEYVNRELSFADVDQLRRDARDKYQTGNKQKADADYQRTRADFYRMELDRLDQVSKGNRGNLCESYLAYLRNTPGSKKAVGECVKEAQKRVDKKGRKGKRAGAKQGEAKKEQNGDVNEKEGEAQAAGGQPDEADQRPEPDNAEGEQADAKNPEDSAAN